MLCCNICICVFLLNRIFSLCSLHLFHIWEHVKEKFMLLFAGYNKVFSDFDYCMDNIKRKILRAKIIFPQVIYKSISTQSIKLSFNTGR